ncbi:MAG: hypothetical protein FIB03_00230 [Anaerolineae bacterium]|nr:hypothetical protein [Anaerolineae bacterium]
MGPKNEKKDGGKKSRDGMGKKRQGGTSTLITPKPVVKTIDFPILQFPRSVSKSSQSAGIVIKKWCIENRVPVGRSNNAVPVFFLNVGNVVEIRQQNIRVPGDDNRWTEIVYIHNEFSKEKKKWVASTITGWVNELYLDPYYEKYSNDEVKILHPTEDPTDARQYMIWDGDVRYNMCGELCVAHIIKKDIDPKSTLESVLQKWKDSPNKGSFSYTPRTIKFGTNAPHLKDILELYPAYNGLIDGEPILAFRDGLKAGVLSWEGMKDRLNTHYLVALVVIDKTGTLIPRDKDGVQHWVLVEKVTRNGNRVELYNPFPNRLQEYSFNEFASSCRVSLSGLWVKRKRPLRSGADGAAQERPFEVTLDVPKPPHYQAQQYIDREGGKKTQLCGEFSVAYVLGKSLDSTSSRWRKNQPELMDMLTILKAYGSLSGDGTQRKPFTIGAVLDCWRETQPQLYKHHVVENRPTGTRELISILRAYGYNNPEDFVGFQAGLMDTATRKVLPSPGRMAKMLKTHYLIAGVGIDGTTGRLKSGRAVRHWVVVERMLPIGRHYQTRHFGGNGGWVELYNPFTNILEEYSYLEFTNSMSESGAWDGLWVKRQIQPLFKPQQALFPTAEGRKGRVGNAGKKDAVPKWNEEKLRALIEKKLRNGKAPERVLNELSRAGTGWSMEEIASRIPNIKKPDSAQTDDLEALTEHGG